MGNVALGISAFDVETTATKTTVVGRDAIGGEVGRLELVHGRFTLSEAFKDDYDTPEVDGRKVDVRVKGQTMNWETAGFLPMLNLPAHPAGLTSLGEFLADPHVKQVLDLWGVGFEGNELLEDGEQAYINSVLGGTNFVAYPPGTTTYGPTRPGLTANACSGTSTADQALRLNYTGTLPDGSHWNEYRISQCCSNGTWSSKACPMDTSVPCVRPDNSPGYYTSYGCAKATAACVGSVNYGEEGDENPTGAPDGGWCKMFAYQNANAKYCYGAEETQQQVGVKLYTWGGLQPVPAATVTTGIPGFSCSYGTCTTTTCEGTAAPYFNQVENPGYALVSSEWTPPYQRYWYMLGDGLPCVSVDECLGGYCNSGSCASTPPTPTCRTGCYWNTSHNCCSANGTCFVGGTPITMADGSARAIETVREGDSVMAYDTTLGRMVPSQVTRTFVHDNTEGGTVLVNGRLRSTPNHPFFANGRWVRADELLPGDSLMTIASDPKGVAMSAQATQLGTIQSMPGAQTVYNIEVAGYHDYFADGVLVHNKGQVSNWCNCDAW